jgi:hypothetical protein
MKKIMWMKKKKQINKTTRAFKLLKTISKKKEDHQINKILILIMKVKY